MKIPFGEPRQASTRETVTAPEKPRVEIDLDEDVKIIYETILAKSAEGATYAQLLEELSQQGLVDVPDGHDEVFYRISERDETPEYDAEYVPKFKQLSVYSSDHVNDACSLLKAKGLIRRDADSKKWFPATPERAWEKPVEELLDVKLLKIPVESAKEQIRRYQREAPRAEVAVIGDIEVFSSFHSTKPQYKRQDKKLTLPMSGEVHLSTVFEKETEARTAQIEIEVRSEQSAEQLLLAIEAPEGTLRALMELETGKALHLPVSELGFDPTETGMVFRLLEISQ